MIVYNVTNSVDKQVAEEWISWMKDVHIPEVLKTGMFTQHRIYKVLNHDDEHTFSYAVQYYADSMERVDEYLVKYAPHLRAEVQKRYGERVVAYRTLLEDLT